MGFNQQKWEWGSVKIGVICWVNIYECFFTNMLKQFWNNYIVI